MMWPVHFVLCIENDVTAHGYVPQVLLDKLNDFQLALVVCRLYEIDDPLPESVRQLLYKHILGMDESGKNCSSLKAHADPFLRSMALWMLQDYQAALNTLLEVGCSSVGFNLGKWQQTADRLITMLNIKMEVTTQNFLRLSWGPWPCMVYLLDQKASQDKWVYGAVFTNRYCV